MLRCSDFSSRILIPWGIPATHHMPWFGWLPVTLIPVGAFECTAGFTCLRRIIILWLVFGTWDAGYVTRIRIQPLMYPALSLPAYMSAVSADAGLSDHLPYFFSVVYYTKMWLPSDSNRIICLNVKQVQSFQIGFELLSYVVLNPICIRLVPM